MFDAKKLLDAVVTGTSEAAGPAKGNLGALLAQLATTARQKAGEAGEKAKSAAGTVGDMARKASDEAKRKVAEDGGIAGLAKQVLGQATAGVKDAAHKVDNATGAGAKIDQVVKQVSGGKSAGDLLAQAKDLVRNNPGAAAALAGALGALVLGTRTGRSLATDAAKLGGLVLIGGLAYKAYQNHKDGKPILGGEGAPDVAPAGSGFEAAGQSNEHAMLYLRAMIAAAASDGIISNSERDRIMSGLKEAGLDPEASQFLEAEFRAPASIAELAAGARSPEVAAQVYAAARVAIEPDSEAEQRFLGDLASALRLDPDLVAHIDAGASGIKV